MKKIYFLIPLFVIISTLSVFANVEVLPSPSSTINVNDLNINNSNMVLIKIKDTNSMLPTFDENNIVLGVPISSNTELGIGDIVVYDKNGLVIHRIIDIVDDKYLLKGDNNKYNDGFIQLGDIKYKSIGVIY